MYADRMLRVHEVQREAEGVEGVRNMKTMLVFAKVSALGAVVPMESMTCWTGMEPPLARGTVLDAWPAVAQRLPSSPFEHMAVL